MIYAEYRNNLIYLNSQYTDKEKLKSCGAKWDLKESKWYIAFDLRIWNELEKVLGERLVCSPILKSFLVRRQKEENNFLDAKKNAEEDKPIDFEVPGLLYNGINPLFNYQKHGVQCGCIVGDGFLIGDQPGLGKSIQGIGIALERRRRGEIESCMIVCPASLKYNWVQEIQKFTKEKFLVIDGDKEERKQKWFAKGYFFKIVNYEAIVSDIYSDSKKGVDKRIDGSDYILNNQDMLIVDEIQYIKNHTSQRTKIMKKFKAKYRVGLTGTPLDGRLEELHSIFQFLKPGLFPNKTMFMDRYAILDRFNRVIKYRNEEEIKEKIKPYYIRRLKENVLKELPPKIFKDVFVELPKKEKKAYMDLIKGRSEVTQESQAATIVLRARQFLDFPELIDMRNPSAKYAALSELLSELIKENKEKVIIFTQFKKALHLLVKNLESDYNIVCIHGDIPASERIEICNRFNNDPSVNIIIMTNAGATGLNLASANSVINYEDDFSPATNLQRFDRAHRANTKHTVQVVRFISLGTIEEHVRDILDTKMSLCNKILDENIADLSSPVMSSMEMMKLL